MLSLVAAQSLFITHFQATQKSATRADKLVAHAKQQLTWGTTYDPAYTRLKFPGGDVPKHKGVCTDVVIRAYRSAGIDLQVEVRNHKSKNIWLYSKFGAKVDTNIDHRRCTNLTVWFRAKGRSLPLNREYQPGDVVFWKLPSGLDHIGLVSDIKGNSGNFEVIHNMSTPQQEDALYRWKIVAHFRY